MKLIKSVINFVTDTLVSFKSPVGCPGTKTSDSREFEPIPISSVIGKANYRYSPFDKIEVIR